MQDYNINVKYDFSQDVKETNAISTTRKTNKKTSYKVKSVEQKTTSGIGTVRRGIGAGFAIASKINSYVGEMTENRIQQRNTQTTLGFAALGFLAITNPVAAVVGAGAFIGDRAIKYQIKQYKSNLTADFMKQLSNGVYNTRK